MEYAHWFVIQLHGDAMSLSPTTLVGQTVSPPPEGPNLALIAQMRRGASWFTTIAVLSGINTLLQAFDAKIRFIFGLGITQVVDSLAHNNGQNGTIAMILVDGLFIALLILCGKWARGGSQGAFLGGMIAYALDGVLLLLFGIWIDGAVHAYVLWRLWQGYSASRELAQLSQNAQPGMSQVKLP